MFNSLYDTIRQSFVCEKAQNPALLSPITLAYIGDTVYDLFVRSYLLSTTDHPVSKLHMIATHAVCSSAQAKAFHAIENMLSDDELCIYKRGRNAHSTVPKNSDKTDYRIATGFETLLGYLYLSEQDNRITELMHVVLDIEEEKKEKLQNG